MASRSAVEIGAGGVIDDSVILGYASGRVGDAALAIGDGARLRSGTVVYGGSTIGRGLQTGHNVVIRPLCYSAEEDIAEYARLREFPILPCDLCGSQDNLKRQRVKQLIEQLNAENPNVRGNLFAALGNVRASQLMPGPVPVSEREGRLRVLSS